MSNEARPPFSWADLPKPDPKGDDTARGRVRALCVVEKLRTAFQPVFRARTGELIGCEALLRLPPGSGFAGPYEAFTEAIRIGLAADLEVASTERVLQDAEPFAGDHLIFLNVLAPFLTDPRLGAAWLVERIAAHGRQPSRVILELPEISRIADFNEFARALEPYRREGFRVAIDDFGAGYTNLRMITDIAPDFVKLDRVFIENIFVHARKRILVESVVSLCHRINCGVVAEGIETSEDLETCLGAGVDFLQGFLLARPAPAEEAFFAEDLTVESVRGAHARGEIDAAVSQGPTLPADAPLSAANACFSSNPDLDVIPILLSGRVIGVLDRARSAALPYLPGFSATDPVSASVSDSEWDQVDETTPLEQVTALIGKRPKARRYDPVVVTGPGKAYRGLVRFDDLLALFVRLYVENGLETHPLTNLPGRGRLEAEVGRRLALRQPFGLARLNLRRFRPFNDRYGFPRGDKLLSHLAAILKTLSHEEPGSFLAHYGGDDFGFLLSPERSSEIVQRAVHGLSATIGEFYDPEDLSAGGVVGRDSRGGPTVIAPVGLVAGMAVWGGAGQPTLQVISLAAETALREARNEGTVQPVVRPVGPLTEPTPAPPRTDGPPPTWTSLPRPFR
ncbi:MAG: EAL and GGDEF domain-containing protein [Thermoanaerobaculia bacterium]|nr:EAL and GGDEF domain-containing protein [Thermoanaerobaculia bacterium]